MNPWKCVPIYLHVDGDNAQVGLWCDECQLPSMIRFPIIQLSENGVTFAGYVQRCADCEGYDDEDDEEGGDDGYSDLVCG